MPSTYSTSLRLELMADGEKSGTWGTITNTNLGTLIEQGVAGVASVAHDDSASYTLTTNNGSSDEARNAVVLMTGALTADREVIVPDVDKVYIFKNGTSGGFALTFKTSGGSGVTIPNGRAAICYVDSGTGTVNAIDDGYFTDSIYIEGSSAGDFITAESTNAGATSGPDIKLYRNSASPADSDVLSKITFTANTDNGAGGVSVSDVEYASINVSAPETNETSGEAGKMVIALKRGGTTQNYIEIQGGTSADADNDSIVFKTGGSAVLTIDNNQDMLVDTDSKLQFRDSAIYIQSGSDGNLSIEADTAIAFDTDTLYVDSANDRVGVGTASPDGNLTVGSTTTSGDISIRIKGDATSRGFLMFGDAGGVQLGDIMYDHSDNHMRFRVNNAERMRIDSSGNVGIGTSSPAYPLEVMVGVSRVLRAGTSFVSIDATGSASAPSLIIDGDDNTGFWHPASDTLAVSTAGSETMRIDASGNVGIGTSSSASGSAIKLNLNGSSGGGIQFTNNNNGGGAIIPLNAGGQSFYTFTGAVGSETYSERMRIDSSGNVLVGTTSDYGKVTVIEALSGGQISVATSTSNNTTKFGGVTGIHYTSAEERVALVNIESNSSDSIARFGGGLSEYNTATQLRFFTAANNTTVTGSERMRIDSSGNVGIGTTSASQKLHVQGDAQVNGYIFQNDGTNAIGLWGEGNADMRFGTNNAERMRIDSSGNLLVNRSSAFTTAKTEIQSDAGDPLTLALNTIDTDGNILSFYKAGITVGSIGNSGSNLILSNGDGSQIKLGNNEVVPTSSGKDLGNPTDRWRDLWLSGGVYLGGTGAANKLDDYEEGTWTPAVTYGTINSSGGIYTKIGRVVHCAVVFDTVSDTSNGNAFEISGLPFDADPNGMAWGSSMWKYNGSGKHICYISSSNKVYFYNSTTGGAYGNLTHNQLTSGAGAHIFFTYTTSA